MLKGFCPGDVMLADALYCNYFLIATLMRTGVGVLFEQNGRRITDFHRGQSLGTRDRTVRWRTLAASPEWMTPEQYAAFFNERMVREVRVDHQVHVTTLVDHRKVSKYALSESYTQRWNVELDRCNLNTTTGMGVLSCQKPQMNEKQLWVHLLAYNAIRLRKAQATSNTGVNPRELSIKHTVQRRTEWVARGLSATRDCGRLFTLIAQCKVSNRPARVEPRKRRPRPYLSLKIPRAQARRKIERHGHA